MLPEERLNLSRGLFKTRHGVYALQYQKIDGDLSYYPAKRKDESCLPLILLSYRDPFLEKAWRGN